MLAAGARRAVGVDLEVVGSISMLTSPSISGATSTPANAVWRRDAESNGEIRTRRWTPFSAENNP